MALEVEIEYRKAPPRCLLVLLVLFPKGGGWGIGGAKIDVAPSHLVNDRWYRPPE